MTARAPSPLRRPRRFAPHLDAVRNIVIFGADRAGVAALDLARVCGWNVLGFIDSRRTLLKRRLHDLPVSSARALAKRNFDLIVVSTQLDPGKTSRKLEGMGFVCGEDFMFADDPVRIDGARIQLNVLVALRSGARVVLFGTGQGGVMGMGIAEQRSWRVVYCVDNNAAVWGAGFGDWEIRSPDALRNKDFDIVLVCSLPGKRAIFEQLNQMGFEYQRDYLYYGEL